MERDSGQNRRWVQLPPPAPIVETSYASASSSLSTKNEHRVTLDPDLLNALVEETPEWPKPEPVHPAIWDWREAQTAWLRGDLSFPNYLQRLYDGVSELWPPGTAPWLVVLPWEPSENGTKAFMVLAPEPPVPGDKLILRRIWEEEPMLSATIMWPCQGIPKSCLSETWIGAAHRDALWAVVDRTKDEQD